VIRLDRKRRRRSDRMRIYICMNCGRVRVHGKWRYMTIEEETKLALENVEWIKREQCLGCYQLVNNSEFGKYTKVVNNEKCK